MSPEIRAVVSAALKAEMDRLKQQGAGATQADLGALLGVSQQTVSRHAKDSVHPMQFTLAARIADITSCLDVRELALGRLVVPDASGASGLPQSLSAAVSLLSDRLRALAVEYAAGDHDLLGTAEWKVKLLEGALAELNAPPRVARVHMEGSANENDSPQIAALHGIDTKTGKEFIGSLGAATSGKTKGPTQGVKRSPKKR